MTSMDDVKVATGARSNGMPHARGAVNIVGGTPLAT
jgi:hypothetical protein